MAREQVPRHQVIETYLRERLAQLQPGDLLPTEKELCELFGVSRMTARQAVMRLAEAGLVRREPGRGTFVAHPRLQREISMLLSFTRTMASQGKRASAHMIAKTLEQAEPEIAAKLDLAPNAQVVRIRRRRFADNDPMALETVWLPADRFGWLMQVDLTNASLHEALEQRGTVPSNGDGTLTAGVAAKEEAHQLGIPVGAPLLVERLVLQDQDGIPIQVGETRYAGERYALDFHLHRNA
ncbi:MAG TPA: GntR family transcriptional regulator [Symbiobacteriaceae bacterium]|nr:GntR family transcriptional regulator [Symbiobacteriaceae bacterium]